MNAIDTRPMRLKMREIEERLGEIGSPVWVSRATAPNDIMRDEDYWGDPVVTLKGAEPPIRTFIEHAPDDITALLGMVKQLLEEVEDAK